MSYAYDLRVFFRFLQETNPALQEKPMADISIQDLSLLQPVDFEEFQEYLKAYQSSDHKLETNSRTGIARKMSCLRSFYDYLCKRQLLQSNPVRLVDMPKIKEKAIIQLDPDEVASLLDYIENYGKNLTGVQLYHYNKQKYRDIAIVTLLLGCLLYTSHHPHSQETHGHHHVHRGMAEIMEIVEQLRVNDTIKEDVKNIYMLIAQAEAKVHGKEVSDIHFHEVGTLAVSYTHLDVYKRQV